MKFLNLTKGFNPYNANNSDCIKFESFFFNGGEPHIKIDPNYSEDYVDVQVTTRITSMNDFMMLLVALDALYRIGLHKNVYFFIPYFPGARQDRVAVDGEPLTVKVFADLLNKYELNLVQTFDNHSDVSTAVIDNCESINNHAFVETCIHNIGNFKYKFNLISPDAGANKKAQSLLKYLISSFKGELDSNEFEACFDLIKCDKTRDVVTGKLTGFEVYSEDLKGGDCVIVDDICDGGGTFIGLAKELKAKNAGDIYLIVSHGIFSKPLKELQPYFKKIYTTDSLRSEFSWEQQERDCVDFVEIVEFKEFL